VDGATVEVAGGNPSTLADGQEVAIRPEGEPLAYLAIGPREKIGERDNRLGGWADRPARNGELNDQSPLDASSNSPKRDSWRCGRPSCSRSLALHSLATAGGQGQVERARFSDINLAPYEHLVAPLGHDAPASRPQPDEFKLVATRIPREGLA